MEEKERKTNGEKLRSVFNKLWDKALDLSKEEKSLSYRDMVRIADAIRNVGPDILNLKPIPKEINMGLNFAIMTVDPTKAKIKEQLKTIFTGVTGVGGVGLIWFFMGTILNPAIWGTVVAFVFGGLAFGPAAIVGVLAGIAFIASAIYLKFQKLSPSDRLVEAHKYVMMGIDKWIYENSEEEVDGFEDSVFKNEKGILTTDYNDDELSAIMILFYQIAKSDNLITDEENKVIEEAIGKLVINIETDLNSALNNLSHLSQDKKKKIVSWCFKVALTQDEINDEEKEILTKICDSFNIDYNSMYSLFAALYI